MVQYGRMKRNSNYVCMCTGAGRMYAARWNVDASHIQNSFPTQSFMVFAAHIRLSSVQSGTGIAGVMAVKSMHDMAV